MKSFKKINREDEKKYSREEIYDIYDENNIIVLFVDATKDDVTVPSWMKYETKLRIYIEKKKVSIISFKEKNVIFKIESENNFFEYSIPYDGIRFASGINPSILGYIVKFIDLKKFIPLFLLIYIISILYIIYTKDNKSEVIYGYKYFEYGKNLWNSEKTFENFLSVIVFLLEFYLIFILLIFIPIDFILNYFSVSGYYYYTFLFLFLFILVFVFDKYDEKNKNVRRSLIEIDLNNLGLRPIFKITTFKVRRNYCFYIGPFSDEFTEIYEKYIKPNIIRNGFYIQRSDEIFGTQPVMNDIWKTMNESSILLADLSGRNPNVMYEIGMAHVIGKKVIIIAQNLEDVPFDLRGFRCIFYKNHEKDLEKLSHSIVNTIMLELSS